MIREVGGRRHPKPGITARHRYRDVARDCGQSRTPEGFQISLKRLHKVLNSRLRYFNFSL